MMKLDKKIDKDIKEICKILKEKGYIFATEFNIGYTPIRSKNKGKEIDIGSEIDIKGTLKISLYKKDFIFYKEGDEE